MKQYTLDCYQLTIDGGFVERWMTEDDARIQAWDVITRIMHPELRGDVDLYENAFSEIVVGEPTVLHGHTVLINKIKHPLPPIPEELIKRQNIVSNELTKIADTLRDVRDHLFTLYSGYNRIAGSYITVPEQHRAEERYIEDEDFRRAIDQHTWELGSIFDEITETVREIKNTTMYWQPSDIDC